MQAKPLMLVILDGWGYAKDNGGNAIAKAKIPFFNKLFKEYPHALLNSYGEYVGLPAGQMGNSEVGHLNIGAGRVVYQELTRINKEIKEESFYQNQVLIEAMERAKSKEKALHLMGLLSDGGVHSHIAHLFALLELAKRKGLKEVFIHVFLDGRDVQPNNAKEYLVALEKKCKEIGLGKIASIMGRYYAMDRDNRWDRVALAYNAIVNGEGQSAPMATAALEKSYHEKITDEFLLPTVITDDEGEAIGRVEPEDSVIFFNFRADRAREITRAFVQKDFQGFVRKRGYFPIHYVCFTEYEADLVDLNVPIVFKPQNLEHTLGEVLSDNGLKQLRIAETEKYAHVTFFFNGGIEEPYPGEERILIASPKVATYNLQPEMSGQEVVAGIIKTIEDGQTDVIIANFANPDMVGHTGILSATIKAIESVDNFLEKIVTVAEAKGWNVIITADHGNAEQMLDAEEMPVTSHSNNKVPFILVVEQKNIKLQEGSLQDIAPTILELLGIPKPKEMTGESLIQKES